jgi:uncharacterized repeat protein (TIGR01451 family)
MRRCIGLVVLTVLMGVLVFASPAFAEAPFWQVTQVVAPTVIAPGGKGEVIVTATNLGDAPAEGASTPVELTDVLPAGLIATSVRGTVEHPFEEAQCSLEPLVCTFTGSVLPYHPLVVVIGVEADGSPGGLLNHASVAGGGARSVSLASPVKVGNEPLVFGVEQLEVQPFNEDGSLDTQAGSHPFELTTTLNLNQRLPVGEPVETVGMAKDTQVRLPPGLIGNPEVVPRCTEEQFAPPVGGVKCPVNTVIGVAIVTLRFATAPERVAVPIFNLVPSVGEPARFAFAPHTVPVYLDTSVRTGGDYGVTVSTSNISQIVGFEGAQITVWGVPGDPRHDSSRGADCLYRNGFEGDGRPCEVVHQPITTPFLTMPTSCAGPFEASALADSWEEPSKIIEAGYTLHDDASPAVGLDGCNRLSFDPSVGVAPDGQAGSTPTGLTVGVHVPQDATLTPSGLAEADVRNTTVALPAGLALNPAAADGLESCSIGQVDLGSASPASCPEASKVGTVEISTPLLPNPLVGAVYLAAQNANRFGSLIALYIIAEEPVSGTLIKVAGEVKPDPVTGQLVSTFKDTPQLPFSDLRLHFFGGSRAPLSTPALCGGYTTTASIAPWSGNPPVASSSEFRVTSGPNGGPCASPLPFSPSLTAGATSIQAGGFSPFTMTMSREDGQQNLQAIQLHMPPGLSGLLAGVKLCEEAQANAGTCGPDSQIGETIVSVGLGGDPFSVKGGKVYITGPYEGAPFGLSIVNPAKAGPFDLGQVVVRARIEVDPVTSALTITSDTTGPYKIPTMLDGIPLEIKHVNVTVNRQGFTFNPTNCNPMQITGSLSSTEGASQALSVPFQVTNCATLAFKPGFKVSTSGKTSRANGASLSVKLTYPKAVFGSQANIKTVKVDLPKQLPSRLSTLQRACPDKTFNENPALCSAASRIGQARATTPLIPVPLSGPVYFVSHGGAKFPELIIVLQGYGVTVDLHSETFISKAGITSSTFHTVPDVPVGSFELTLPQGPFSALAANGNLCASKLRMPTAFTAQNGMVIHQNTPISVTGCAKHKAKKARKARKATRRHSGHGGKGEHGKR